MTDPGVHVDAINHIDLRVHDPAALEEIELYAELMIVAAASSDTLPVVEIDRVLGIGGDPGSAVTEQHIDIPPAEPERLVEADRGGV